MKKLKTSKKVLVYGMFSILFVNLLGFGSFSFLATCSQNKASAHPEGTDENDIIIHMKRGGYDPKDLEINQGDVVIFENIDSVDLWPASNIHPTHEIYSDFDPKGPVEAGDTWTFKFEEPGVWKYHDHLYPNVTGDITVKEVDGYVKSDKKQEDVDLSLKERVCNLFLGKESLAEEEAADHPHYDESVVEADPAILESKDVLYSHIKKYGTKSTMQVLHSLELKGTNCHEAAHNTGRYTYEIEGAQAFKTCSAECHSGCYHGATEAYFKEHGTDNLKESLKLICNNELNAFYSHQCIHGIGHGLMAWADYEIHEALRSCDLLESGQESCYSGVFMENIVGGLAEEEGHQTDYLSDDPHFPCSIVEEKYKNSCYFMQTSRMRTLYADDFAKVAAACSGAPQIYQASCFGSMGRDVSSVYNEADKEIAACANVPAGQMRTFCLQGAVQDSFWVPEGQDYAIDFCNKLNEKQEKDGCYLEIFGRAPQVILNEGDLGKFCDKVDGDYKDQCKKSVGIG